MQPIQNVPLLQNNREAKCRKLAKVKLNKMPIRVRRLNAIDKFVPDAPSHSSYCGCGRERLKGSLRAIDLVTGVTRKTVPASINGQIAGPAYACNQGEHTSLFHGNVVLKQGFLSRMNKGAPV